jgi:hypothetical protein
MTTQSPMDHHKVRRVSKVQIGGLIFAAALFVGFTLADG